MMPLQLTPTLAIKALLPTAFFGYAAVANLALLVAPDAQLPAAKGLLDGRITQEIDTLYRDNLPHKDPAVGLIGAARYLLLDEGRPGVMVGDNGTLFTTEEFRPSDPETYARALDEIVSVAQSLGAEGASLTVVPLPAKVDLLSDLSPDTAQSAALEAFYQTFVDDLSLRGVNVVDSRPALTPLAQPFLATDTHWSPDGATSVAQQIAESGAVANGDDGFSVEGSDTIRFAGDLVSYVTSDALAPRIGLALEEVIPYQAIPQPGEEAAALDLFGDAAPTGVDLVGTSYSANPNWSFAEALKLALGRDVINHAEEGRGPFKPMQAYLDARHTSGDGAADVLWEIPVRYLTDPAMVPGLGAGPASEGGSTREENT